MRFQSVVRALASKNLRLYFSGQGISLIGSWITTVASSWLVYRLTDSEFLLGVVAFVGQFPTAAIGPFAGVLIDRFDRRKVLLVTQFLSMLQSFALAALAFSGSITVVQIVLLNAFQAAVNGFDTPARQSFLAELVEDRLDLPNAIALNAALFHGSRLIGPAIAGVLVAYAGEGPCFLIDGFSYLAVLLSLYLISGRNVLSVEKHHSWRAAMVAGIKYSLNILPIRQILIFVFLFSLLGAPHLTLMPVIARDVLSGGPELYGNLMSVAGTGAFFGALFLASRDRSANLGSIVAPMPLCMGLSLFLLAAARTPWVACVALFISGFSMVTLMAGMNSIVQSIVDDRKRARVMSFYSSIFFGMLPLGGVVAGAAAHAFGAPVTVAAGATINLALAFFFSRKLREVHRRTNPEAPTDPISA